MKRKELIRLLGQNGWWLNREGDNHSIYTNGTVNEQIPRHAEIRETLAKDIIKKHGLKK